MIDKEVNYKNADKFYSVYYLVALSGVSEFVLAFIRTSYSIVVSDIELSAYMYSLVCMAYPADQTLQLLIPVFTGSMSMASTLMPWFYEQSLSSFPLRTQLVQHTFLTMGLMLERYVQYLSGSLVGKSKK